MVLDQVGILVTGVIAVWLTQDKRESWRRWAPIFGLLAQPFWFYAAWKAEQWGIFAITTLYTYAWFVTFALSAGIYLALMPRQR